MEKFDIFGKVQINCFAKKQNKYLRHTTLTTQINYFPGVKTF